MESHFRDMIETDELSKANDQFEKAPFHSLVQTSSAEGTGPVCSSSTATTTRKISF